MFYASFIPGLRELVSGVIKERLPDVKILKLLDGAVVFETAVSYDKLNFFCFNNIFAVINIKEETYAESQGGMRGEEFLGLYIRKILQENYNTDIIASNNKKIRSFRIVVSNENTPAAIDGKLRTAAEKYIARLSGLKVNRSLPDTEFWFLYRNDKKENFANACFSVFMKRLSLRASWEKTLHKGELPPPLAWALCRLANLSHSDTVIDPCCGYGAIPYAAMKYFHITKFIACDNSKEAASFTSSRFKKQEGFTLHNGGFEELTSLAAEKSVDVIVTDPPWGHFNPSESVKGKDGKCDFLFKMFDVFGKLLKNGGRAVILYPDDAVLEAAPSSFELQNKIPILLSGKKTAIYQFTVK